MTTSIPQFGQTLLDGSEFEEITYAFVIIQDGRNRVALRNTEEGHILPGFVVEDDEDEEEAIIRHIEEETGLVIEVKQVVGEANEYIKDSNGELTNDIGTFYSAIISADSPAGKKSTKLFDWYTTDTVTGAIDRRSHIWAISRMLYQ